MAISVIWWSTLAASILYSCYAGTTSALTPALVEGISSAVQFCLSTGGMMIFWCGLFRIAEDSGLAESLAKLLRPLLRRLFPTTAQHSGAFSHICANVSANLLGLGNAATPMGISAVQSMAKVFHNDKEIARLVVMNTASIQLLPTTVAAVRSGLGCSTPMDILPCVLITSVLSVSAGLIAVEVSYRS